MCQISKYNFCSMLDDSRDLLFSQFGTLKYFSPKCAHFLLNYLVMFWVSEIGNYPNYGFLKLNSISSYLLIFWIFGWKLKLCAHSETVALNWDFKHFYAVQTISIFCQKILLFYCKIRFLIAQSRDF